MVNVLNYKSPNIVMEVKEEQVPLIVKQKRFLEQLIEGNLEKARKLAQLPEEERYRIAVNYILAPDEAKKCLEENPEQGANFKIYLESIRLAPAWDLKDEPKDIRDRIRNLSLRGIRRGVLQTAEIKRITDPEKITRIGSTYFIRKFMDPLDRKPEDTNEEIRKKIGVNPIEEEIKKVLIKDPILKDYFTGRGYELLFDIFCSNVALNISRQYDGNFLEE